MQIWQNLNEPAPVCRPVAHLHAEVHPACSRITAPLSLLQSPAMTRFSGSPTPSSFQPHDPDRSSCKKRLSGCGLSGQRRRTSLRPNADGVGKPALRRLARKAGVKRISVDTYAEARTALNTFLGGILKDVSIITESARRMTVTVPDVLLALKRHGRTLYGFGEINSFEQYAHRIRRPVKRDSLQRATAHMQREQAGSSATTAQPSYTSTAVPSNRLSNNGAEQPVADTRLNVVPATPASPSTPHQPSEEEEEPNEEPESPMSEELREHIQGSVGEYVSKVYQYDPPGSVYKVRDLHKWVASHYFQRKGMTSCSPEQLHTILYALDEEGQVMISSHEDDLQIRFVM